MVNNNASDWNELDVNIKEENGDTFALQGGSSPANKENRVALPIDGGVMPDHGPLAAGSAIKRKASPSNQITFGKIPKTGSGFRHANGEDDTEAEYEVESLEDEGMSYEDEGMGCDRSDVDKSVPAAVALSPAAYGYYKENGCTACAIRQGNGIVCDKQRFPCDECKAQGKPCMPVQRPMATPREAAQEALANVKAQFFRK
ncbi:hypothetical protein QFC20_007510 [Naganishia adeliensis]|uniref:Uncharacterized protein n=1 Tax=Naganishia adeliensis TaxID=92952 RepID=A0ACC2UXY7_9TREE|nr:hypothetical protein QFC20_007510 [Naganishia adeliensis]